MSRSIVAVIAVIAASVLWVNGATYQEGLLDQDPVHVFVGPSSPVSSPKKRGVEFMGMHVSYPQYVRLRSIQREVIKMDQMIRKMVRQYDPEELASNPHWMELLELYDAMKKMLPDEYLRSVGAENPIPIRRSAGLR